MREVVSGDVVTLRTSHNSSRFYRSKRLLTPLRRIGRRHVALVLKKRLSRDEVQILDVLTLSGDVMTVLEVDVLDILIF